MCVECVYVFVCVNTRPCLWHGEQRVMSSAFLTHFLFYFLIQDLSLNLEYTNFPRPVGSKSRQGLILSLPLQWCHIRLPNERWCASILPGESVSYFLFCPIFLWTVIWNPWRGNEVSQVLLYLEFSLLPIDVTATRSIISSYLQRPFLAFFLSSKLLVSSSLNLRVYKMPLIYITLRKYFIGHSIRRLTFTIFRQFKNIIHCFLDYILLIKKDNNYFLFSWIQCVCY